MHNTETMTIFPENQIALIYYRYFTCLLIKFWDIFTEMDTSSYMFQMILSRSLASGSSKLSPQPMNPCPEPHLPLPLGKRREALRVGNIQRNAARLRTLALFPTKRSRMLYVIVLIVCTGTLDLFLINFLQLF